MLARIVENWLTSVSERGYQSAFAQVLSNEGYRLLHAPVHHPFEHGKDISALSPSGELHAFQLKDGDIDQRTLEGMLGQLFALAGTTVSHPAVQPSRPPNRVFLVTNGDLTPPAHDRLRAFNEANRTRSWPTIETIERDHLVTRFIAAHGAFLPTELSSLNDLLAFVLSTGAGPFPVERFSALVHTILNPPEPFASKTAASRALAAVTILTSYASGPWARLQNHWGTGEAWLVAAFASIALAERQDLDDDLWLPSFLIARDGARRAFNALLKEAADAPDLVVPDVVDGIVYPVRAAITCGYASALFLCERELDSDAAGQVQAQITTLLKRELEYLQVSGEAGAPYLALIATALEVLQDPVTAVKIILDWARGLATLNATDSQEAIPDPYHPFEELLRKSIALETSIDEEHFAGESYTLQIAIDWFARRNLRPAVDKLWPLATHVAFATFRPATPAGFLLHNDPGGQHEASLPPLTQSWAKLREEAGRLSEADIPRRLWQHLEVAPFLPLLYPHRFTPTTAKLLDYMVFQYVAVELQDEKE